jgi:hypothetical protein
MDWLRIFFLVFVGIVFLSGCSQVTHLTETAMVEMVEKSVILTVAAFPSPTLPPTATELPTGTPTVTETPTETATPTMVLVSSPTSTRFQGDAGSGYEANICDNAAFVSDVSVPDGTRFAQGTTFTKTWRLSNTGTCTWTDDYSVTFVNGSKMNGSSPQELQIQNLKPGETIDISIVLVAPSQFGSHTGYWRLQNGSKVAFGDTFYVQIQVSATAHTLTPTPTKVKSATASPTASVAVPSETATLEPSPTDETP